MYKLELMMFRACYFLYGYWECYFHLIEDILLLNKNNNCIQQKLNFITEYNFVVVVKNLFPLN